jgi:serine/threonine protein kinase
MHDLKTKTLVDNRFEIIERIGFGGMGVVYKAEQVGLDRTVALKVMLPHLLHDEKSLARFELEAQALATLKHRNILLFYAYGIWHGRAPYIAMEYLDSGDLSDMLIAEGGRLSWRRTLDIMRQIADAVAHAHHAGIVHRDLKPSNIFIERDGDDYVVKVADFGLAKFIDDDSDAKQKLTATGLTVGSPHYMSPEQAQGLVVTPSSDIYSVGCIMYQCLFGRPPYNADNMVELLSQHLQLSAPLPKMETLKDFPPAVIRVLELALAKDPANRFATMDEMCAALAEVQRTSENLRDSKSNFVPQSHTTAPQARSKAGPFKLLIAVSIAMICLSGLAIAFNIPLLNGAAGVLKERDDKDSLSTSITAAHFFESHGFHHQAAPFYEAAMSIAHDNADDWRQMEIALEAAAMFKRSGQIDQQQAAFSEASLHYSPALSCPRFKSASRDTKQKFVVSSAMAMADWKPAQPITARQIQDVHTIVHGLGLYDEQRIINANWLKWHKVIDLQTAFTSSCLNLADDMYHDGLDAPYRKEVVALIERAMEAKLAKTPVQVAALSQNVLAAVGRRNKSEAIRNLLPLCMDYCIVEHSPDTAAALSRAVKAYATISDDRDDLYILATCYDILMDFSSVDGNSETITLYRHALANENQRAIWDESNYELRFKFESALANLLLKQHKPDAAIAVYQGGIATATNQRFKQRDTQITCFIVREKLAIAEILASQGKWKETVAALRQVCSMPEEIKGINQGRYADHALADALAHLYEPEVVAKEMGTNGDPRRRFTVFCDIGRPDLARREILSIEPGSPMIDDHQILLMLLAHSSHMMGENDEALAYLKRAKDETESLKLENKQLKIAHRNLESGKAYYLSGKDEMAKAEFLDGIRTGHSVEKLRDMQQFERGCAYELANVLFQEGDYKQAAKYYSESADLLEDLGYGASCDYQWTRAAQALAQKDLPTARREAERALNGFYGQYSWAECISLTWIAQVLVAEGKREQAKEAICTAIAHWRVCHLLAPGSCFATDYTNAVRLAKSLGVPIESKRVD